MLGASRISSVLGLKARPKTAMVLSVSSPPSASITLLAIRRFRASLASMTEETIDKETLASSAVRVRAIVSFGKQEPP